MVSVRGHWTNDLAPPWFVGRVGGLDVNLLLIVQSVGHSVSSLPDDSPSSLELLVFLVGDIVNQRLYKIRRGRVGLRCIQQDGLSR